ncbi:MAG: efflux RND transporter periplasmic adaptor subunit [Lactovum sp.]
MKKHKTLLISVLSVVILLSLTVAVAFLTRSFSVDDPVDFEMETYLVEAQPSLIFSGMVEATQMDKYLKDASLGTLSKVEVKDGEKVKVGQVLLTYEAKDTDLTSFSFAVQNAQDAVNIASAEINDANSQINQLTTRLNQSQDELEKSSLREQIDVLNQGLGQQHRSLNSAQLALSQAQTQLSEAQAGQTVTIKASQDGIAVVNKNASETEALVTVVSNTKVIKGSASEFDYKELVVGSAVNLTTLDKSQTATGKVDYVSLVPMSTSEGLTISSYTFTVSLDKGSDLQYGFSVEIELPDKTIYIPETAVKDNKVQLKKDGEFIPQEIKYVKSETDMLQVTEGLNIGDEIRMEWTDGE